jgi:signal transduction histidine kinase
VREVLVSLGPLVRRSPVTVRVEQEGPVPVTSRPGYVAQVVTNFVSNALMHAFGPGEAGELVLRISREGDRAVLSARYNGRGMAPEVAARAFDPFFTTRRGTGGSGLGLFIVHNLVVDGLGGSVTVASAPGEGSTFRVAFPLKAEERPCTAPLDAA